MKIEIPEALGHIEVQKRSSDQGPLVIYIQDAHAVVSAQNHIRELIAYLRGQYGINLVALEGGSGTLDPLLLRSFPDAFVKGQVFRRYLERGELTGASLSALLDEKDGTYAGIEDWKLYEDNYFAYRRALERQGGVLKALEIRRAESDRERQTAYSPEMNAFHEKTEAFRDERLSLPDFLKYLSAFSPLPPIGPELTAVMQSLEAESNRPQGAADVSIKKMAEAFERKNLLQLTPQAQKEWSEKTQAWQTGALDSGSYLQYLIDAGRKAGLKPRLSPALREMAGQAQTLSMVKGTRLFGELEALLKDLTGRFAPDPGARELAARYERLRLLRDLARMEVTREQYEKFRSGSQAYLDEIPGSRENLLEAVEFYEIALERDAVFQERLETLMKERKTNAAIVVTGGFHARGFERALEKSGASYAIVTPKIDSLTGSAAYAGQMRGEFSFKKNLETSFYDAFMKHASGALSEELKGAELGKNLRAWREEVIRRLALEGRASESGAYTRYIDLLWKTYREKYGRLGKENTTREGLLKAVHQALRNVRETASSGVRKQWETRIRLMTEKLRAPALALQQPAGVVPLIAARTESRQLFDAIKTGLVPRQENRRALVLLSRAQPLSPQRREMRGTAASDDSGLGRDDEAVMDFAEAFSPQSLRRVQLRIQEARKAAAEQEELVRQITDQIARQTDDLTAEFRGLEGSSDEIKRKIERLDGRRNRVAAQLDAIRERPVRWGASKRISRHIASLEARMAASAENRGRLLGEWEQKQGEMDRLRGQIRTARETRVPTKPLEDPNAIATEFLSSMRKEIEERSLGRVLQTRNMAMVHGLLNSWAADMGATDGSPLKRGVPWDLRLKMLLALPVQLSAHSVRKGDQLGNFWSPVSVILTDGFVASAGTMQTGATTSRRAGQRATGRAGYDQPPIDRQIEDAWNHRDRLSSRRAFDEWGIDAQKKERGHAVSGLCLYLDEDGRLESGRRPEDTFDPVKIFFVATALGLPIYAYTTKNGVTGFWKALGVKQVQEPNMLKVITYWVVETGDAPVPYEELTRHPFELDPAQREALLQEIIAAQPFGSERLTRENIDQILKPPSYAQIMPDTGELRGDQAAPVGRDEMRTDSESGQNGPAVTLARDRILAEIPQKQWPKIVPAIGELIRLEEAGRGGSAQIAYVAEIIRLGTILGFDGTKEFYEALIAALKADARFDTALEVAGETRRKRMAQDKGEARAALKTALQAVEQTVKLNPFYQAASAQLSRNAPSLTPPLRLDELKELRRFISEQLVRWEGIVKSPQWLRYGFDAAADAEFSEEHEFLASLHVLVGQVSQWYERGIENAYDSHGSAFDRWSRLIKRVMERELAKTIPQAKFRSLLLGYLTMEAESARASSEPGEKGLINLHFGIQYYRILDEQFRTWFREQGVAREEMEDFIVFLIQRLNRSELRTEQEGEIDPEVLGETIEMILHEASQPALGAKMLMNDVLKRISEFSIERTDLEEHIETVETFLAYALKTMAFQTQMRADAAKGTLEYLKDDLATLQKRVSNLPFLLELAAKAWEKTAQATNLTNLKTSRGFELARIRMDSLMNYLNTQSFEGRPEPVSLRQKIELMRDYHLGSTINPKDGGDVEVRDKTEGRDTVLADPGHLIGIPDNLIRNAQQHSGKSSATKILFEITPEAGPAGNAQLVLTYKDDGRGLTPEAVAKLLGDPEGEAALRASLGEEGISAEHLLFSEDVAFHAIFQRGRSTKAKEEGTPTGLGMYMVKRAVLAAGGRIERVREKDPLYPGLAMRLIFPAAAIRSEVRVATEQRPLEEDRGKRVALEKQFLKVLLTPDREGRVRGIFRVILEDVRQGRPDVTTREVYDELLRESTIGSVSFTEPAAETLRMALRDDYDGMERHFYELEFYDYLRQLDPETLEPLAPRVLSRPELWLRRLGEFVMRVLRPIGSEIKTFLDDVGSIFREQSHYLPTGPALPPAAEGPVRPREEEQRAKMKKQRSDLLNILNDTEYWGHGIQYLGGSWAILEEEETRHGHGGGLTAISYGSFRGAFDERGQRYFWQPHDNGMGLLIISNQNLKAGTQANLDTAKWGVSLASFEAMVFAEPLAQLMRDRFPDSKDLIMSYGEAAEYFRRRFEEKGRFEIREGMPSEPTAVTAFDRYEEAEGYRFREISNDEKRKLRSLYAQAPELVRKWRLYGEMRAAFVASQQGDEAAGVLLDRAIDLAAEQYAQSSHPIRDDLRAYVVHPLEVAYDYLLHGGQDKRAVLAALFHDFLEDTAADRSLIASRLNDGDRQLIGREELDEIWAVIDKLSEDASYYVLAVTKDTENTQGLLDRRGNKANLTYLDLQGILRTGRDATKIEHLDYVTGGLDLLPAEQFDLKFNRLSEKDRFVLQTCVALKIFDRLQNLRTNGSSHHVLQRRMSLPEIERWKQFLRMPVVAPDLRAEILGFLNREEAILVENPSLAGTRYETRPGDIDSGEPAEGLKLQLRRLTSLLRDPKADLAEFDEVYAEVQAHARRMEKSVKVPENFTIPPIPSIEESDARGPSVLPRAELEKKAVEVLAGDQIAYFSYLYLPSSFVKKVMNGPFRDAVARELGEKDHRKREFSQFLGWDLYSAQGIQRRFAESQGISWSALNNLAILSGAFMAAYSL
ncbi:MAG: ATP-binding protein, partial [Candidatus Omnitrophota bacterium]